MQPALSLNDLLTQARARGFETRFAKRSQGLFEAALYLAGRSTPIRVYSSLSQALALEEALLLAMPDAEREAALRVRFPESKPLPAHCEDHDLDCRRCEEDRYGNVQLLCACGDDALLVEAADDDHGPAIVCFSCAHQHQIGDRKCPSSQDGRRCIFDENHRGACDFDSALVAAGASC